MYEVCAIHDKKFDDIYIGQTRDLETRLNFITLVLSRTVTRVGLKKNRL
jgi:hypothetical protein